MAVDNEEEKARQEAREEATRQKPQQTRSSRHLSLSLRRLYPLLEQEKQSSPAQWAWG